MSDARVMGRGVLDAAVRSNKTQFIALTSCTNLEMNGVIVLGSFGWTLVPKLCEQVRFRHVKVASWRDNDDGLDVVSSRPVTVENCFFRTKDEDETFGGGLAALRSLPSAVNSAFVCFACLVVTPHSGDRKTALAPHPQFRILAYGNERIEL